jgi:hypothetical protein
MTPVTHGDKEKYEDTPQGQYARWKTELDAAAEAREEFLAEGREAMARYKNKRKGASNEQRLKERRWNLWYSNKETQLAVLYGRVPEVKVSRQYNDQGDDAARVAAEILERILNAELDAGDSYTSSLEHSLKDFILPGMGWARVRHEREEPQEAAGAASEEHEADEAFEPPEPSADEPIDAAGPPPYECAEVEWVAWDRVAWSAGACVWHEVQWVGFKSLVSRATLRKHFAEDAERIPLNARTGGRTADNTNRDRQQESPWDRAAVWEIWDKDTRKVYWLVEGYEKVLKAEDDPLSLEGFFPCPEPMAANLLTDAFMGTSDWTIAKDLYQQIDTLQARRALIVDAIRVAGVYDSKEGALKKLITSTGQNDLYPVENWGNFKERGGLAGAFEIMSVDELTKALVDLGQEQASLKAQLDEVTGMPDILRGQSEGIGITATEQRIKGGFASARLKKTQERFARFASELASIRAEIICSRFAPANIIAEANMQNHPDMALVNDAIALLKSPACRLRVRVEPEGLAMANREEQREENQDIVSSVSGLVAALTPLLQIEPGAKELALDLLGWLLSRTKGASEVEGMVDRARALLKRAEAQPKAPPAPDPKVIAQQMKGQQEQQKIAAELQADLTRTQAEMQANRDHEQSQAEYGIKEAVVRDQISQRNKVEAAARAAQPPSPFEVTR